MHHQRLDGSAVGTIDEVPQQMLLRLRLLVAWPIQLRPDAVVAVDEPLVRHDLHQLQHRGVAGGLRGAEHVLHLANGQGAAVPQDAEDGEFGFGWFRRGYHAPDQ